MEFTRPMPAAAAVPVRKADGMGQKIGMDPITPSVPMDRNRMFRVGCPALSPHRTRARAPTRTSYT